MLIPKQEKQDLVAFMTQAIAYFDAVAEGCIPVGDPAALFSEGLVCLRRIQITDNR